MSFQPASRGLRRPPEAPAELSEAVSKAFQALVRASKAVNQAHFGPREALADAEIEHSRAVFGLREALSDASTPSPGEGESGFPA